MVVPNVPRFLREDDQITLTAKVVNLSDSSLSGTARLDLLDAFSMQSVDAKFGNTEALRSFTVAAGESYLLSWISQYPKEHKPLRPGHSKCRHLLRRGRKYAADSQ